ncbi:MAG: M56 family metallopeptidase [Lachnospiraceae bacterium]|nr:M56 family metallopeptidase [Lachnospiraceae bacterium]
MKITFFSVMMSILWGSVLILLFSLLRKKKSLAEVCSTTGVVILYVFCAVRMLIPIELPWVMIIPNETIYNPLYDAIRYQVFSVSIGEMLVTVWCLGTVIQTIRLIVRYRRFWGKISAIKERGKTVSDWLTEEYGIQKVRIIMTDKTKVPMTVGVGNYTILIPEEDYSDREKELILRHELTHIKNGDLIIQLLSNVLCVVYWWNPAVYLFRKNLEQYFELRCDGTVTSGMSKQELAEYLEILLKIYKNGKSKESGSTLGVIEDYSIGGKELKERFECLSKNIERTSKRYIGRVAAFMLAAGLLIMSYSFIIQSDYPAPEMEEGSTEVTPENAYVVRQKDGSYTLRMDSGFQTDISEKSAEMLIEDGFTLVEE